MWIKTENGNLVNMDNVSAVMLNHAKFRDGDGFTEGARVNAICEDLDITLCQFGEAEAAEVFIDSLLEHLRKGTKVLYL